MEGDLLASAPWHVCATAPGDVEDPAPLASHAATWWPATVPGTAAGALRAAGADDADRRDYDGSDWWYRCTFHRDPGDGPWSLHLGGLATLADVWLNGQHLLHSENMFRSHAVEISHLDDENELVVRFASLGAALQQRRPRPRWKTSLFDQQNLRWFRTVLLGRLSGWAATPAPVGPWRPVTLTGKPTLSITSRRLVATCDGDDGLVELDLSIEGAGGADAVLRVGEETAPLHAHVQDDTTVLHGTVRIAGVQRWWPHTHGAQPLYGVTVEVGGTVLDLGKVGFRTIEVQREGGAFEVVVNGLPVFCRGAVWMPVDPVSLTPEAGAVGDTLDLARRAHLNMVRLPGTGVYQDDAFWDRCDELGLLVWQDCMLAFGDPPDTPEFLAEMEHELTEVFSSLGGRPALAVVCGGQEIEEQASMLSVPRARWGCPVLEDLIPGLVQRLLPGVPYVTSNPTGGYEPSRMDTGVSHYFGIGGYLRPVEDARRAGVRFAAECLAFATPPERSTIDDACGGPTRAGHDPAWKLAVHHDAGRSWDLEDMQGIYLRELFETDPVLLRYRDAERALDLGRATVVTLMERVLSEWRRPQSTCAGALVLALRDLRPGAGWGVIDALGRPKAPWFALRRVMRPVAALLTDEGLNGLRVHLVNDTDTEIDGVLRIELFVRGELRVETGERPVVVPARGGLAVDAATLFDAFHDLNWAYRFTPPAHDVVAITLVGPDGAALAEAVHLPGGVSRSLEPDIGLETRLSAGPGDQWQLEISTRRFAQWVVVEVPGYRPDDSWFHLAPGARRLVVLERTDATDSPRGEVRAFNAVSRARVKAE